MSAGRFGLRPPTRPAWHASPDLLRILWTQPRSSVRWLIDHGGLRLSILLVCGASATAAVSEATMVDSFRSFGVWAWVLALAVEMLLGLVAWLLGALLLLGIGRAFGGVGAWGELMIALAWGQAPVAAALPFALLRAWSRSLGNANGELLSLLLLFVCYGWALVTTTFAVAEAHRFSFARGMLSMGTLAVLCSAASALAWYAIP
jgi:hypothetical protein